MKSLKSVFVEERVSTDEAILEEAYDVVTVLEACNVDVKFACACGEQLSEFQAPVH